MTYSTYSTYSEKHEEYDDKFRYSYTSIARSFLFEESDEQIYNELLNKNYNEEIIDLCKQIDIDSEVPGSIIYKILDVFNFYEKSIKVYFGFMFANLNCHGAKCAGTSCRFIPDKRKLLLF